MLNDEEAKSAKASPRDLSAQIRNWAVALSAVAGLIAYVVANPVVWRVTVALVLAAFTMVPVFLLCLVVMNGALIGLSFWMRSPNRMFIAKSFSAISFMTLTLSAAMYELQFTSGVLRLILFVLYMGFGGAFILFIEIIAPKWEERGYLRYPKGEPQILAKVSPVSRYQTSTEEQRPSSGNAEPVR